MKSHLLIRWLAAAALTAAPLANAAYSGLYVFGDSLSDSGNNAIVLGIDAGQVISGNGYIPSEGPYASGHYTDGAVWAQDLATALGVSAAPSLAGGTDYAFGGAQTGSSGFPFSLTAQIGQLLPFPGSTAPSDALYVVAGGGNNARATLASITPGSDPTAAITATALSYAIDIGNIVDRLQAAGVQNQNIIVWNTPNIGLTPAVQTLGGAAAQLATSIASAMNNALQTRLSFEAGVKTFDVFDFLTTIVTSASHAGLSNVTDACGAIAGCDPSTYLFWDGIHPTSAGHELLAGALLALAVPEPSDAALWFAGVLALLAASARRSRTASGPGEVLAARTALAQRF